MEQLVHTRDLLKTSLQQSREISFEIYKTSAANVSRINHTFPSLESRIRNMASKCATFGIKDLVERALPPLYSVFMVYKLVLDLQTTLQVSHRKSSSCFDDHLNILKRLRQSLALLTNTCKLAIRWVQDVKQFLDQNTTTTYNNDYDDDDDDDDHDFHPYHSNVIKTLYLLEELQGIEERSLLDEGILGVAFRDLKHEFKYLLIHNSFPLQIDETDNHPLLPHLPFPVVDNLKAIITFFANDNHHLDECMSIYTRVRTTIVQTSLQGLGLDYLEMPISELESMEDIQDYVDKWGMHLEFLVKHLLEFEYVLCNQLFGHIQFGTDCFSKIAFHSRIQDFIKFGNAVTKGKKEALKLFKLLDLFSTLNNIRHVFNKIYGGKPCLEIQNQMRDLIRKVVNGACDIFKEISAQIELQRLSDPPPDGTVPRLLSFVTEYFDELLDEDYRLVLDQVLEIYCSWNYNNNKTLFTKGGLNVSVEVHNMVKMLELNLETWAKRYEDVVLSYIFIMNTSYYLSKHLKGTKLGNLMGESWIKLHEDRVEYYTTLYLKRSWEKLPAILIDDNGGAGDDAKRKRIKGFNDEFDQVYKKHSGWVLCDRGLRWKTCQKILQVIVPVYKNHMINNMGLIEGADGYGSSPNNNNYIKYSAESLENLLTSMFQPKLDKYGSSKCTTNLMGKIKSAIAGRFSPIRLAAA
ncbi:exocyst complex component EXO70A1-like [Rutidosis leptorrhynchoides]|uniref:exocyst complex component EXO70A1-like n=1 Tax=Rutidosis leptorrhynchoides TaxID=125765 RepID=UPI003A9928D4